MIEYFKLGNVTRSGKLIFVNNKGLIPKKKIKILD